MSPRQAEARRVAAGAPPESQDRPTLPRPGAAVNLAAERGMIGVLLEADSGHAA